MCVYTNIRKERVRYVNNAPMAILEFVDRDVEAKRVDKPKIEPSKEAPRTEHKKESTA